MPTWYVADQSRSASSAWSEHQCNSRGELDAGSIACVPSALSPEVGEDPAVIVEGNRLALR